MHSLRYIHAADLHLDTTFSGLRHKSSNLHENLHSILQNSTFTALERLVNLCEREKPDFLVIAGDIYNEEDQSLKAHLALRDACIRLQKLHIPVFLVHGNHDPMSSRLQSIVWPDNTYTFGTDMNAKEVKNAEGATIAIVHGISHASNKETRNIVTSFSRIKGEHANVFQLGLAHCAIDSVPPADRYAPCSVEDLKKTELDAFALGHVHQRRIVCEAPFVLYSGNTQGLHINEQGERGCYLVSVTAQGQGFAIESDFHALGPVIWEKLNINIEDLEQAHEVEERIQEGLHELRNQASLQCEALLVRVILTGRTVLDGELRYKNYCQDLCERIQSNCHEKPYTWLKDICVETAPLMNVAEMLERDDLLGETLRLGEFLQGDSATAQTFIKESLSPLYDYSRARQHLLSLDADDAVTLLQDANRLCAELMENR